jgi:electron transfer flavoprotein alpha subunit
VRGVLAVVSDSASGAAGLAQRYAREAGIAADLVLLGDGALPSGTWQRVWSGAAIPGPGAPDILRPILSGTDYRLVLFDETPLGREAAGRLAARAGLPVIGQVVAIRPAPDALRVVRLADAGARTAVLVPAAATVLAVVSASVGGAGDSPGSARERQVFEATAGAWPVAEVLAETRLHPAEMELAEADVVVAGGRGVGGREGFAMLEELAGLLGGTVGASRVAVDAGWIPYARQVGLTGKTVAPRVYIACGISGAPHHVLGMRNSTLIVAINADARAPIFQIAHVSLVGRVEEVVPQLISELRQRRPAPALPATAGAR